MQEPNTSYLTPNHSPSKRPIWHVSLCESTPPRPILKKQRLFSPSSPATPDEFPASFCSPIHPSASPRPFLDSSCDSLTGLNEMAAYKSNDVMVTSPPRLERLQLLDYPRTPLSIARSSGLQVPSSSENSPRSASRQQNMKTERAYSK